MRQVTHLALRLDLALPRCLLAFPLPLPGGLAGQRDAPSLQLSRHLPPAPSTRRQTDTCGARGTGVSART
jgi:hypothetical protein